MMTLLRLPQADANKIMAMLNGALTPARTLAQKYALLSLMEAVEAGLSDSPEAWWRWAQEAGA